MRKGWARGRGCLGRGDMVGVGSSLHSCWAPAGIALHFPRSILRGDLMKATLVRNLSRCLQGLKEQAAARIYWARRDGRGWRVGIYSPQPCTSPHTNFTMLLLFTHPRILATQPTPGRPFQLSPRLPLQPGVTP